MNLEKAEQFAIEKMKQYNLFGRKFMKLKMLCS